MALEPTLSDDPYGSPELYDLEYADMVEDVEHYVRLARRYGLVCELGCGTGRLTIPMLRAGATVHGIDIAASMLQGLERKLKLLPPSDRLRARYQVADFRDWQPPMKYPLVMWPFNAMHHCRDGADIRAVLSVAEQALATGGTFAMDCYLPDLTLYDRDPEGRYEARTFAHPDTGERIESWEQGWWEAARNIHHVVYIYAHEDGTERRAHLELRMFTLDELTRIISDEGWKIRWQARDFTGKPVTSKALKWVAILERAR